MRSSQQVETLCDYNDLVIDVMQGYLDNYVTSNGYNAQCHDIISEEFVTSFVGANGIPQFCTSNCDIDFDEFCPDDYPEDPSSYFPEVISQIENNFNNRCGPNLYVPTFIQFTFGDSASDCDCEWELDDDEGCLKLSNGLMPPVFSGCDNLVQISSEGYCVVDKDYGSCTEITNQCGEPVRVDPGDGFEENLCSLSDPFYQGNEFCIDLEEGECVTLDAPTDCNCENPEGPTVINGIDLIAIRKVILGFTTGFTADEIAQIRAFGDLNCDGGLSNLDLIILQRYILGIDDNEGNGCAEIGECVLLNPREETEDRNPTQVCYEDFENGPINIVQGIYGDPSGSCCGEEIFFTDPVSRDDFLITSYDNGVYLKKTIDSKGIQFFLKKNALDISNIIVSDDITVSLTEMNDIYSIYIDFIGDVNEAHIRMFGVNLTENIEFDLENDLYSYIITKSGVVHLLNEENIDG